MNTFETELQAASGFLADQLDDIRLLLETTPREVLSDLVGQSLLQQLLDTLSRGVGSVLAHKLIAMPKGK